MSILAIDAKNWGSKTKVESRQPIIDVCRELGVMKKGRSYFGLGGQLFNTTTKSMQPWCEYDHFVHQAKIMSAGQYHSVEHNPEVVRGNLRALPHLARQLYTEDIGDVLYAQLGTGKFRPGLIGLDTTSEPKLAIELLCNAMDVVNHVDGVVVVALNMILWSRKSNRKHTWRNVTEELDANGRFHMYYPKGWREACRAYDYVNRGTTMGTLILVREATPCSD